jgi:hypothetical protein
MSVVALASQCPDEGKCTGSVPCLEPGKDCSSLSYWYGQRLKRLRHAHRATNGPAIDSRATVFVGSSDRFTLLEQNADE